MQVEKERRKANFDGSKSNFHNWIEIGPKFSFFIHPLLKSVCCKQSLCKYVDV